MRNRLTMENSEDLIVVKTSSSIIVEKESHFLKLDRDWWARVQRWSFNHCITLWTAGDERLGGDRFRTVMNVFDGCVRKLSESLVLEYMRLKSYWVMLHSMVVTFVKTGYVLSGNMSWMENLVLAGTYSRKEDECKKMLQQWFEVIRIDDERAFKTRFVFFSTGDEKLKALGSLLFSFCLLWYRKLYNG